VKARVALYEETVIVATIRLPLQRRRYASHGNASPLSHAVMFAYTRKNVITSR